MIRRNVANQTVTLPPLQTTAEGTPVDSGATVRVKKDAGSWADAAGTPTYGEDGCWDYTPTAAETDCAILKVKISKTGASAVVFNLVTTAADTTAAAFGANTTAPATPGNVTDARDAVIAELPAIDENGNISANLRRIAGAPVAVDTGTEGTVSFVSGAYVMTAGSTVNANVVEVGGEAIHDDGDGRMEVVPSDGPVTTPRELTFTSGDNPVVGATVTITETDGTVIWIGTTNSSGVVTPSLAAGSYRAYLEKAGFLPNNPYNFTVT
jgi:hypothetical protein